ncbi:MAG: autotransporter-associated beta strand repeat-containing protein, partial [Gammaproteobacteria bacterium]
MFLQTLGIFDIESAGGDREIGGLGGDGGLILLGDRGLAFGANNADNAFSGSISGSGTLTKQGSGRQFLYGSADYTGPIRIEGGVLAVQPAALGPVVVNNAALEFIFNKSDNPALPIAAYSGDISGTGTVSKLGDGALWLRGTNSYTGGTEIRGGALIGDTASLRGDVLVNDAIAAFYQIEDGTYAGSVSGNGLLLKYGPGRLSLTGASSHSGGTAFTGALRITGDAALGASGATLSIVDGTLELDANVTLNRPLFVVGDSTVDTRRFDAAFLVDGDGPGSLTKNGLGQLTLHGRHAYGGPLSVTAGRLRLLGTVAGDVIVHAGAQLGGTGAVDGDLLLTPGSTLAMAVDATGGAEFLRIGGHADVEGSALDVDARAGDYAARTR